MNYKIKEIGKGKSCLAVISIIIAHIVINVIWLKNDSFPLWFDYGGYFKRSIEIYYASQSGPVDFVKTILGIGGHTGGFLPYRVFLPLSSLPWYYIFGLSPDTAVLSCSIFFAIAVFSVYLIASVIFDRITGIIAAFLITTSPGFFVYFRRYSPEFAVTGLTALAAYFLLRSCNMSSRKHSVLFGVIFALAMITKEMAFAFIIGIFLYVLLNIDYSRKDILKNACVNLAFSAGIAALTILLIYSAHFKAIINRIFEISYSDGIRSLYNMPDRLSWAGILFYINDLARFSFSPFYFILFIIGAFFAVVKKVPKSGFIFCFFLCAYFILSSMQIKAQYYGMPLLIPCSIFAAHGMARMAKSEAIKPIAIFAVVIYGSLQLLYYSFPVFEGILPSIGMNTELKKYYYPVKENWRLDEIVDYIQENNLDKNKVIRIHMGVNLYAFSPMTLGYASAFKKAKFEFCGAALSTSEALSCDFVVVKSGKEQGIFYSFAQKTELENALNMSQDFTRLLKVFSLPDNSDAVLYKRVRQVDL